MKILKLNETGEWPTDLDLRYVEEHPEDTSGNAKWIRFLKKKVDQIITDVKEKGIEMSLLNIKGHDEESGPYAIVNIAGREFKIWDVRQQGDTYHENFFIEDFPIDNQEEEGNKPGFAGDVYDLIEGILDYFDKTEKLKIKNYNEWQMI